jgi:hypothetical protein
MTGRASSRQNTANSDRVISRTIRAINELPTQDAYAEIIVTSGHESRRSLDEMRVTSHRPDVNELERFVMLPDSVSENLLRC